MTTIIFTNGTIFSDSKGVELIPGESYKNLKYNNSRVINSKAKKIFKRKNILYAYSGVKSIKATNQMKKWLLADGFHRFLLSWTWRQLSAIIWDGQTLFFVETKKTKFFGRGRWKLDFVYKPLKTSIYIIGSGSLYAREAVKNGMDAREAIRYAAKHDPWTNNIVQSKTIECRY